jgi:hypothetical protein
LTAPLKDLLVGEELVQNFADLGWRRDRLRGGWAVPTLVICTVGEAAEYRVEGFFA